MIFGQANLGNRQWFAAGDVPWHCAPLEEFPHLAYLRGDRDAYASYLRYSWGSAATPEAVKHRMEDYDRVINDVRVKGIKDPITTVARPDGKEVIVHGNHRACIATHFKRHLPKILINNVDFFRVVVGDRPYHSFYSGGFFPMALGRRRDTGDRARALAPWGKSVLDLGCNAGGHCYLVNSERVLGVDKNTEFLNQACRLNCFYGRAGVDFQQADLNAEQRFGADFDDVCLFSVWRHVTNHDALIRTILWHCKKRLLIETHAGQPLDDYKDLLVHFKDVTAVGYGESGEDSQRNRMWVVARR